MAVARLAEDWGHCEGQPTQAMGLLPPDSSCSTPGQCDSSDLGQDWPGHAQHAWASLISLGHILPNAALKIKPSLLGSHQVEVS